MREVIVRQIGSKAWEAHHAFIASEIRANISAQLSSFRATGTPSDVPHTGTANKSRPVTSHHRTEPTINQSQARNTWQSRSTPAVLNSTSLALASSQTASRSVPSFSKAEGQSGKSRIRSASAHVTQSHASPSKSPGPTVSSASAANPPASGCRRFTTGSGSGDTPRRHLFSSADDSTANDSSSPSIEHEALPPAQHSRIWAWGGSLLSGRTVRHVAPDNFGSIESASAVDIEGALEEIRIVDRRFGDHDEPSKVAVWPFLPGQRVTQICASGDRAFLLMHNGDLYRWDHFDTQGVGEVGETADISKFHNGTESEGNSVEANGAAVAAANQQGAHKRRMGRGEAAAGRHYIVPQLVPVYDLMVKRALTPAWKALNIACGPRHVLCTTDVGQVFSWGSGSDGRLGHGDTQDAAAPKVIVAIADQQIWQVACGNAHSTCISVDGVLYTWGRGANGRLGHGTQNDELAPQVVEIVALDRPASSKPKEIVQRERTLSGSRWKLGGRSTSAHGSSSKSGKMVKQQIHAAACGWNFTAIVTTLGDVYCMGRGTEGQCGTQTVVDRLVPHVVETLRGKHFHVTGIACGCRHTLALCRSGDVFSWGLGDQGQLGNGAAYSPLPAIVRFPQAHRSAPSTPSKKQPTKSKSGASSGSITVSADQRRIDHDCVSEIACGPWHSVAVTAKGRVFTWGLNKCGQLGLGDRRDRGKPELVRGLPHNLNVGHITCIASASLLLERQRYQDIKSTTDSVDASTQSPSSVHTHTAELESGRPAEDNSDTATPHQHSSNTRPKPAQVDAWRDMVRPSALKYASPREQHFYNIERAAASASTKSSQRGSKLIKGRTTGQAGGSGDARLGAGGKLLTHTRYSSDAFGQITAKLVRQEMELRRLARVWSEVVLPNWNRIWMALVQHQNLRQLKVVVQAQTADALVPNGASSVASASSGLSFAASTAALSSNGRILAKLKGSDKEQDKFQAAALASIFEESPAAGNGRSRARSRSRSESSAGGLRSATQTSSIQGHNTDSANARPDDIAVVPRRVVVLNITSLWLEGIPAAMRSWVWPQLIGNSLRITPAVFFTARRRVYKVKHLLKSARLGSGSIDTITGKPAGVGGGYPCSPALENLLRGREKTISLIDTDLPRTLPYLRLFGKGEALYSTVRDALEAFVCHRPELGYIQGLSYIAAVIALFVHGHRVHELAASTAYSAVFALHIGREFALTAPKSEDPQVNHAGGSSFQYHKRQQQADSHTVYLQNVYIVFQCLVNVMIGTRTPAHLAFGVNQGTSRQTQSHNAHHQELRGLSGCSHLYDFFLLAETTMQHYYDVFDVVLQESEQRLWGHLRKIDIKYDMFLFMWLQTVFLRVLPLDTAARVWDLFLVGGTPVLFQTAIAILRLLKSKLLAGSFEQCLGLVTGSKKGAWNSFSSPEVLIPSIVKVQLSNPVRPCKLRLACECYFA
eukprot:INCI2698.1.p1 GENE.INCI2698.1~~INCI2698.1.p1  ORF type:complete len:1629 (-),score=251.56 INCI2698.1:256-4593(-)